MKDVRRGTTVEVKASVDKSVGCEFECVRGLEGRGELLRNKKRSMCVPHEVCGDRKQPVQGQNKWQHIESEWLVSAEKSVM